MRLERDAAAQRLAVEAADAAEQLDRDIDGSPRQCNRRSRHQPVDAGALRQAARGVRRPGDHRRPERRQRITPGGGEGGECAAVDPGVVARPCVGPVEVGDKRPAPVGPVVVERRPQMQARHLGLGEQWRQAGVARDAERRRPRQRQDKRGEAGLPRRRIDLGAEIGRRRQVVGQDMVVHGVELRRVGIARQRAEARHVGRVADDRQTRRGGNDAAIGFAQPVDMVDLCVDVEAPVLLDAEVVGFGFGVRRAAARRRSALALGGRRAKPWTQDEVDDPLVGGSAVFERDFLGQDVHPGDRFGGQVANLAKAGDAPPIDQNQRHPAAAARRIGLRGNRGQQVGDRRNAIAADVGGAQLELGLDVTRNRPRLPPGGDDDLVLGRCLLGEARRGRENHQGRRPNF